MSCFQARPSLLAVEWEDLIHLRRGEVARELTLSLPWLAGSWIAAAHGYYPLALAASFMFFLTGLRQVHNAYHHALGITRRATDWVMFLLSIAMLGSMHAVQLVHLRHHRYCMTADDVEAMSAVMPGWKAILIGPLFPVCLHRKALELATSRQRRWIHAELAANAVFAFAVVFVLDAGWLQYHLVAMLLGQSLTAFFAVWTVHHDCDPGDNLARSIRNPTKAAITYNMFYHLEHHLFPAVPTCKLPILAKRLDALGSGRMLKEVF